MIELNLLAARIISVEGQEGRTMLTLPGVFAGLMRGEIRSFPALRPHQRAAWHAFLSQIGALALLAAGQGQPPKDQESWVALLSGLTPDFPADEPWSLIAPLDTPALLQSPIPGGNLDGLKTIVETPDSLDMLVTAKNHDLKSAVMIAPEPDDWLFALVTLQTSEGFLGAGNYGISRMNGGFSNRGAVGIEPSGGIGAHLLRDILRLLAIRREEEVPGYPASGGLGLVWLRPWDGTTSLRADELDPYYVEICRRVRLVRLDGRLAARTAGSKVPRIVPTPGGLTGDPWAPLVPDKDGLKVFTCDAQGFGYRRMVRLMFEWHKAPLQKVAATDDTSGLHLLARALTRGQGKTEGFHERRVPISRDVAVHFRQQASDRIARAAEERVIIAGEIQNRVLKPALLALFENGPDQVDFRDDGAMRRAEGFLKRFDDTVDADFFPRLWEEFEDGADKEAVRRAWVRDLLQTTHDLLNVADDAASKSRRRRYRARAYADAILASSPRRNDKIKPYLGETA